MNLNKNEVEKKVERHKKGMGAGEETKRWEERRKERKGDIVYPQGDRTNKRTEFLFAQESLYR